MTVRNNSKTIFNFFLFFLIYYTVISCSRSNKPVENTSVGNRTVCVSKQYNEIIFALHANSNLVGVDLSSNYPEEIKKIPSVGYHRALTVEGILSVNPDLIIHDNNIGPEHVIAQLKKLQIKMMSFGKYNNSIEGTDSLIREIGAYYHKEIIAEKLIAQLESSFRFAIKKKSIYSHKPKVLVIHYGQASNQFMVMTNQSIAAKIINWSGGEICIPDTKGMKKLSAEIIALADPEVILITDFGYKKLGTRSEILQLPGVATTKAARSNKIYRIEEHDIVYLGPRTGKILLDIQALIHK